MTFLWMLQNAGFLFYRCHWADSYLFFLGQLELVELVLNLSGNVLKLWKSIHVFSLWFSGPYLFNFWTNFLFNRVSIPGIVELPILRKASMADYILPVIYKYMTNNVIYSEICIFFAVALYFKGYCSHELSIRWSNLLAIWILYALA